MRKAFLFITCAMFFLSFAHSSHAFSFWGGGGGGSHGKGSGPAVPDSVFQFDFHNLQYRGEVDIHPYLGGYNSDSNEREQGVGGFVPGGIGGYPTPDPPANGVIPVPEPSTMLLMGAGLIGLVSYGRKKLI